MGQHIPWVPLDYYKNPVCIASITENPSTIRGVICFHDYVAHPSGDGGLMIEMSAAGNHPRWLTRSLIQFAFGYAFGQLGCRRMNTVTPSTNAKAIAVDEKLGFQLEGTIRKGYPNGDDILFYGMLREECRWFKGGPDGQKERRQQHSTDT